MNKRIKLLAEQAGFYFYDMHNVDGQDLGETIEADSWSASEKFAELLVKDYAKKTIQGLMSDPAFVQAMDEYYENKWSHRFD